MSSGGALKRIGYAFERPELFEQAMTHRSSGGVHNERLEFLGDALLGFLVAEVLYARFPRAREGDLTRLRASLVRGDTLAEIAREMGLGQALRLGPGELKSGGRDRGSILADALEALLGAVYLDGGMQAARGVVQGLYAGHLSGLRLEASAKDPKTRLQEYQQARGQPLPRYAVVRVSGEVHAQEFVVECRVAQLREAAIGRGTSKRRAEQSAAEVALEHLDA